MTCDNWFTSISLAIYLLKNHRLTEVTQIFLTIKRIPSCSSMFCFGRECLLVSYVPKRNKKINIHIARGWYYRCGISYNRHKAGVDTVDQQKIFITSIIIFSLLNIAGINGNIIFITNVLDINETRRLYLKWLAEDLVRPHTTKRVTLTLPFLLTLQIKHYLNLPLVYHSEALEATRTKCSYCSKKKNRNTCSNCEKCMHFATYPQLL